VLISKYLFILILFFSCFSVNAENISKLKVVPNVEVLGELVGKTISSVAEFKEAIQLAESSGQQFSTYGGTSREIIYFVLNKVKELGSVEKYKAWLEQNKSVSLVDWHRVTSDIDVLLIPQKNIPPKNNDVIKKITALFPDSIFYANFEVHHLDDFFLQFEASTEHLEPFSNIIITTNGFHHTDHLNIDIDGKKINLGNWGEQQFLKGEFDFRLGRPRSRTSSKEYLYLKQYLRYLRMLSEYPNFGLTKEAALALENLKNEITKDNKSKYIALIKEESKKENSRIFKALQLVQKYSRDSDKTAELILKSGTSDLFSEAGFAERIGSALRSNSAVKSAGEKLGKEIVVYHGTTLDGAQNISAGALYISDGKQLGVEKTSEKLHGKGLYTTSDLKMAKNYGEFYVNITLSKDAIIGTDVILLDDVYLIRNIEAIAKNSDGSNKILPLSYRSIQNNLISNLQNMELNPKGGLIVSMEEKKRTVSGLAKIIDPFLNIESKKEFAEFLKISRGQGLEYDLVKEFLSENRINSLLQIPDKAFDDSLLTLKELFSKDNGSILGISTKDEIFKTYLDSLVDFKTGQIHDSVKFEKLHKIAKTLNLELYFWSSYIKTYPDLFKMLTPASAIEKMFHRDFVETMTPAKSAKSIYQSWPHHLMRANIMLFADQAYRKSPIDIDAIKKMFEFSKKVLAEDELIALLINDLGGVDKLYENNSELNMFVRKELETILADESYFLRVSHLNQIPNFKQLAERRQDLVFLVMNTFSETTNPKTSGLKKTLEKVDFMTLFKTNPLEIPQYLINDKTGILREKIPATDAVTHLIAKTNPYRFSQSITAILQLDLQSDQARLAAFKFISNIIENKVALDAGDEERILSFIEKNTSEKYLTAEVLDEMAKMKKMMNIKNVSYYRLDNLLSVLLVSSGIEKNSEFLPRNFSQIPVSQTVFDYFIKKYSNSHPPSELMHRLALHLVESNNLGTISKSSLDQLILEIKNQQLSEGFLNSNIRSKSSMYGVDILFLPQKNCAELFRAI
jgi:hypothetical protein